MAGFDAVVIGAGVGGLCCAIDLAAQGRSVCVLERAEVPGGKARPVDHDDVRFDSGPTTLTMPWVFEELFAAAGRRLEEAVALRKADVLARYIWPDGQTFDLFADQARAESEIDSQFGPKDRKAFRAFREHVATIYDIAEPRFIRAQRLTMAGIVKEFGALGLRHLSKLDSHRTMQKALDQTFQSPRLRQVFGRYATYCGASPFEAPATLNLVGHVEAAGAFHVLPAAIPDARPGIYHLVDALVELAHALGVELRCEHAVTRIDVAGGRAVGVVTEATGRLDARAVIFNGDVAALADGRLGAEAARAVGQTSPSDRSMSAVTWLLTGRATGLELLPNNVLLGGDSKAEFDALFARSARPVPPGLMIYAPDRATASRAEPERVHIIAGAPPTGDRPERWTAVEVDDWTEAARVALNRVGINIESWQGAPITTPRDFESMYPGSGGAVFGPRSKGATSVLSREGATTKLPGLYLAGGTIHPGPGFSMSALSGRLAAGEIVGDGALLTR